MQLEWAEMAECVRSALSKMVIVCNVSQVVSSSYGHNELAITEKKL